MKIAVVGLGYVGLPLAVLASSKGLDVVGVDKNPRIVARINSGRLPIEDELSRRLFTKAMFTAMGEIEKADAFFVCVPTPVDDEYEPDLSYVKLAANEISEVLEDGNIVVVESTVYPGVCEEIIKPILDRSGKHYYLAHCPERINPGDKNWSTDNIPRVIGGIDPESSAKAIELYRKIIGAQMTPLSQLKAVEATKILENTFRDVNIAFVNEMAQSFHRMGIDVSEVIRAASSKPFAFIPHYPGIGVGGHCIAVDPYYMIKSGKSSGFDHAFLSLARKINSSMPAFAAQVIQDGLNEIGYPVNGTRIAILGIAYKPNVADDRESASHELTKLLRKKKADVVTYDPFLPDKSTADSFQAALANTVCAVIATAHDQFLQNATAYRRVKLVVDGRNCLDKNAIRETGTLYRGIGIC